MSSNDTHELREVPNALIICDALNAIRTGPERKGRHQRRKRKIRVVRCEVLTLSRTWPLSRPRVSDGESEHSRAFDHSDPTQHSLCHAILIGD